MNSLHYRLLISQSFKLISQLFTINCKLDTEALYSTTTRGWWLVMDWVLDTRLKGLKRQTYLQPHFHRHRSIERTNGEREHDRFDATNERARSDDEHSPKMHSSRWYLLFVWSSICSVISFRHFCRQIVPWGLICCSIFRVIFHLCLIS